MSTGVFARARLRARIVSLLAVLAVVAGIVVSLSASTPVRQPRPVPIAEAPDEATAVAAARIQGSRVEVANLRTSTRSVYANPGGTMTADLSMIPTRVKQGETWVPIDTTVVVRPDGTVGPRAADGGLALSSGGSTAPLARMIRNGKSLALFWPGTLPVPTVDGSRATYHEVLPGVDLVMHAEVNGYRQYLVVKTADAARNPALARIPLRIEAKGVRVEVDKAGAVRAVDDRGEPVFAAPPSVMWDSSGPTPDRSASVGVTVDDGSLVLQPDQKFLADPAVKYPVTIDPDMRTWDKTNWASIASGRAGTAYWWRSAAPNGGTVAQVGQCYNEDGECGSPTIGELWAYFQFDTGFVAGRHIFSSEFKSVVVHGATCGAMGQQLYVIVGGRQIWNGLTWRDKDSLPGGLLREVGVPGACQGHQPVGWDVPRNDGIGMLTSFFLKAANGGDINAWRKYDPAQTKMSVHYNTKPYLPDQLNTDPRLPAACAWCAGWRWIGDGSIRLQARLSDPDGDRVRPKWRVSVDGVEVASWDGIYNISGATHDAQINLNDKHNKAVGWWLHADDGYDVSDAVGGTPFKVDLIPPKRAPKVFSPLYLEDNRWHGGVNVPGKFHFAADPEPGEVNDIDHYLYGWSDPPTSRVDAYGALGGGASVPDLAPPGDGPRTLFVQSVDRAGHKSPKRVYRFYVRAGNGPLAQWSFEGNANDTAFLGDRHGTLNGNAGYIPGAVGNAVRLDGMPAQGA